MPQRSTALLSALVDPIRPRGGWLKSARTGHALSLRAVAERLDVSPQAVHQFEKSEAAGTISLRQFENVARVMGFRVVYALLPEQAPATPPIDAPAATAAGSVEHSLHLDNQAAGRFD